MNRSGYADNAVLRWLLVVTLVFAPLQGAFSAIEHVCDTDHSEMAVETTPCHHGDPVTKDDTASEKDCCEKNCVEGGCYGICSFFHITSSLPAFTQFLLHDTRVVLQANLSDLHFGRFTSPPFRPPQG